jgi:nucleoid DNA-binding protein
MPMRRGEFVLQNYDLYKVIAHTLDIGVNKAKPIYCAVIQAMVNLIRSGEPLHINGFGTFKVVTRAPNRYGCYYFPLKTKFTVSTPAKRVVVFKPTKEFKDSLTPETDKVVPTTFTLK